MKPYHDSQGIELYHGDCLHVLKELPAESVHCVVTSPPYWGLRDYGTATWSGGDASCEHQKPNNNKNTTTMTGGTDTLEARHFYKKNCGICGAVRIDKQLGLEETPQQHVSKMVEVFSEVRRVLRTDGTLWLNDGDSYAARGQPGKSNLAELGKRYSGGGHKRDTVIKPVKTVPPGLNPKDLCGIPWRVAFALQADGWWLRQDIIWHKPNPMPESVTDRCTKAHEYIFLLTKAAKYHYDADARKESSTTPWGGVRGFRGGMIKNDQKPTEYRNDARQREGRNRRSVWTVSTHPYPGAHFATFPPKLIEPCIMAGCPEGGTVLDPFLGSGTTGAVAQKNGCKFIGIELNEDYLQLAVKRFTQKVLF